jgi:hypothetical protein
VQQFNNGQVTQYTGARMSLSELERRVKGANLK